MSAVLVSSMTGAVALVGSSGWLAHLRRRVSPELADGAERPASAWWIPAVSTVVGVILGALWSQLDLQPVYQVRVIVLLAALPVLAVIDHRERIVPNRALLVLLALRVPLWIWEAAIDLDLFVATLRSEVIVGGIILGFFSLLRVLHRGGIGMGDVKLFAIMPLFLGTQMALSAILGSLVASFCFAVWAMVTKRKGRKDSFPMVPAIALGTVGAVLLVSIRGVL